VTSSDFEPAEPGGDALGKAHDAVDALRFDALDEAEDVRAIRSFWRELPILIVIALGLAVLLKTFVIQAFYIPSSSMEDTLQVNDRVIVSKLSYRLGDIERGDVVVFDDPYRDAGSRSESFFGSALRNLGESVGITTPESDFIKRVIALPGETIEVRDGAVMVDGIPLTEPYVKSAAVRGAHGPEVVPAGHVFVMGDNRDRSQDSRVFGPVAAEHIIGRAFSVIWPPGNWRGL
jgi:signal peptidase I